MEFTLSLTHRCNLACRYCYGGEKIERDMSSSTAEAIVDFAFDQTSEGNGVSLNFFGGEPLLCLDTMRHVVDYAHQKSREQDKPVLFSVVTNGTLLSPDVIGFFRSNQINLCVSIDGPEQIHNRNRVFPNGRGTFDVVIENLTSALKSLKRVQVNSVYSPETLHSLPDTVSFLSKLGAHAIHLNANVKSEWNDSHFPPLRNVLTEVANRYIDSYREGQELAINLIDSKVVVLIKNGYDQNDICTLGKMEWSFAPSGNAYPCERFIGDDTDPQFRLGNIHSGIKTNRLCQIREASQRSAEKCLRCDIRRFCMNWCICTNHFMSGVSWLPPPVLCVIEETIVREAQRVVSTLRGNDLFIDHFYGYLTGC